MMREWWRRRSLLLRLTLWHAAVVGGITLALGLSVYGLVEHRLHSIFDRDLNADLDFVDARLDLDGKRLVLAHDRQAGAAGGGVRPAAWFEVWNGDRELLLRRWPPRRQGILAFLQSPEGGGLRAYTVMPLDGMPVRVLERPAQALHGNLVLRAYRDETALALTLRQLLIGFLLASPLAALLSGLGGYLMAKRSLAPVGAMAEHARRITFESLNQRLPTTNPHDELGQLAGVFNDTLRRLEDSFIALRGFTADASHELRTPLAALRTVGEVSLREDTNTAAAREAIGSMLEEAAKLDGILESLLTLARAEASSNPVSLEVVDVAALLSDVRLGLGILATERGQEIDVTGPGDSLALANPVLLHQAVMNLLHNAIRHGLAGTAIQLSWRNSNGRVIIEVSDEGPGISAEDQRRIFERFFRVDKARSGSGRGTGLGLAISKVFVEQQGGTIELESEPGRGSRFRIILRAAAEAL